MRVHDEAGACEFYFNYITKSFRHDHIVGFFTLEESEAVLRAKLTQDGIQSNQDKIPYCGWTDPRFRVFVVGEGYFQGTGDFG